MVGQHGQEYILTIIKENKESQEKEISLKKQTERDSINASNYAKGLANFSKANSDSLTAYSIRNSDSLKRFSKNNSDSIKNFSTGIVKLLANYNLKYDSTSNNIFKRIDTTKAKQDPFISHTELQNPITFRQSNDTFYLYPAIRNSGFSAAIKTQFKAYYIMWKNNHLYEYYRPIADISSFNLPQNNTFTITTNNVFLSNFYFDTSNPKQFLLIQGSYQNSEMKKLNFSLCYMWNSSVSRWDISTSLEDIEIFHKGISIFDQFH